MGGTEVWEYMCVRACMRSPLRRCRHPYSPTFLPASSPCSLVSSPVSLTFRYLPSLCARPQLPLHPCRPFVATTSSSSLTSSPIHLAISTPNSTPHTPARSPSSQPPLPPPRLPDAHHYWAGWERAWRESAAWVWACVLGFLCVYGLACVSGIRRSVQASVQAYI